MARDNILLITTDQQRFDTINAWGNQSIFTPHLNYMAAMGISYKNCYASCPICVPSRTTIMTGRQGFESGVVTNATHAAFMQACTKNRSTLPAVLTDAGYQTCAKGKMHFDPARAHYGFEHMRLPLDYMREYDGKKDAARPKIHGTRALYRRRQGQHYHMDRGRNHRFSGNPRRNPPVLFVDELHKAPSAL